MTTFEFVGGKYSILKDPNAKLDYSLDWADWLDFDDTIASLSIIADTVNVVSSGFTNIAAAPATGSVAAIVKANVTTAIVSGGTVGSTHSLTFRITTVSGSRIEDRTVYLKIKER